MIKADHKYWARWIFIPYMNRMLKKNFSHFYLVNNFPSIKENCGLIITPNHISWWDGFFTEYVFSRFVNRKLHIMMLEEQLKRFWFFKFLGAFSIIPSSAKSIIESMSYTREIVNNPANFVITYPQGEIQSFEKRPVVLKNGLMFIIKELSVDTYILPIAFKIQYYNEKHPSIVVRFGELINSKDLLNGTENFEKLFTDNLDLLSEAVENKNFIRDLFIQ